MVDHKSDNRQPPSVSNTLPDILRIVHGLRFFPHLSHFRPIRHVIVNRLPNPRKAGHPMNPSRCATVSCEPPHPSPPCARPLPAPRTPSTPSRPPHGGARPPPPRRPPPRCRLGRHPLHR